MNSTRPTSLSDLLPEERALLLRVVQGLGENDTFDYEVALSLAGKACLNIVGDRADGLRTTARGERIARV